MTELGLEPSRASNVLELIVEDLHGLAEPSYDLGAQNLLPDLRDLMDLTASIVTLLGMLNAVPVDVERDEGESKLLPSPSSLGARDRLARRVKVRRISMNSPLTLELIIQGAGGASLISGLVYLFKNPDKVGGWFGRLQAAWYDGRTEAEKARRAYEKLRRARTTVRELDR
ncbi:hypothetical protein ACWEPC_46950 [Nonomuraea sp. NPDC004297]